VDPSEPNEQYWENLAGLWEMPLEEVKSARCGNCAAFDVTSKMSDCIAEGLDPDTEDPYDVVDAGELGYCRMFKFKCASARTCSAWISGGPITDDTVQETKSVGKERRFVRKAEEKRFTLGPLYVPDFMDAHGEWTDAEELQSGVWHWVRSGDRRIFLQHDQDVVAGEWVEVMTMPQSWTVNMHNAEGEPIGEVTYPPNTVFLGVVWNEEAWEMVKNGELRGYSIGGYSDRMYADLPTDGEREGIELDKASRPQADPGLDIAGSIADAVAAALAKAQPTVNVVLPETRQVARRIERDEHGNIARIIEEEM
ncbi:MAG TPA: XkdF-like putative serine protease domain-containing protein, partial [Acidimicrobiia bacterium]